ncbi:MAG: ATP-dependent sacrificial sulfur transferase LarE [Candidatus Aminicenantaceae bacterium]
MPSQPISSALSEKYDRLKALLQDLGRVLVAFSGGVDSTFLLKVAFDELGENVLAVIATSETYPEKEIQEATLLAESMNVRYRIIQSCEMENPDFVANPPDRCYHCKMELFSRMQVIADSENIPYVLDGANFEDTGDYRPGSRAAEELKVRSPLKETGFVKDEIRELSRHLGLPTWNKPAMACLSSRFPYYTRIHSEALGQIAQAEEFLRSLGLSQLRVRHHETIARIEVPPEDIARLMDPQLREAIVRRLKQLGYAYVTLDLAGYRTGSLNEILSEDQKKGS